MNDKLNIFFLKRIEKKKYYNSKIIFFSKYYKFNFIKEKLISKKKLINIIFLDFFFFLKGLKHLLKLPVNNQRTRSNKNTSYKNNFLLQNHKFFLLKKNNNFSNFLKKKIILFQLKYI